MANNVTLPASGTGDVNPKASTDQVSADSSQVQNVQLASVAGGVLTRNPTIPVSNASLPLPAGASTSANQATDQTLTGGVTETAPGTDTGSSGLNGRLQRIAQRLTSLIAQIPATLGQKTSANSMAVVVASDQSAVPVSGTVTANIGTVGTLALDATLTGGTQKTKLVDTGGTNVGSISAAGALKVDNSAVTQPVSGTVTTTPPSNASSNVAQVAGTAADVNSGNKSAGTLRVTLATDQVQLTNALKVDGSAVTQPVSMATPTSGGVSVSRLLAGASTNATSVKAGAGQVYGWHLANAAAYTVFFKLYNKASAPTVGSDTPFMTIPIPAGAAANVEFSRGVAMGTGIAFATTKLVADSDTTVLVANDLVINLLYA